MLSRFRNEKPNAIDPLIDAVTEDMHRLGPDSDEYQNLLGYLERLNELKAKNRRPTVSRDTVAMVTGNLLSIGLIVGYEQKHVLTTKALSFIRPVMNHQS